MKYRAARAYLSGTYDTVIKDAMYRDCFTLTNQGKVGYNYALCDMSGKKYADVKQVISFIQMITFNNKYRINTETKEILMHYTYPPKINGDPYCKFKGLDWSTQGDIHQHEYSVLDGANVVAQVRLTGTPTQASNPLEKALSDRNRDLEIDCNENYDVPLTLAVVFAIELAEKTDGTRYSL